jgi:hypothetical protein
MQNSFHTGDILALRTDIEGNPEHSLAVVFSEYKTPEKEGIWVIFENGEIDLFDDQDDYFNYVSFSPELSNYNFFSLSKLKQDFKSGMFNTQMYSEVF